jgi:hypothetical protein
VECQCSAEDEKPDQRPHDPILTCSVLLVPVVMMAVGVVGVRVVPASEVAEAASVRAAAQPPGQEQQADSGAGREEQRVNPSALAGTRAHSRSHQSTTGMAKMARIRPARMVV